MSILRKFFSSHSLPKSGLFAHSIAISSVLLLFSVAHQVLSQTAGQAAPVTGFITAVVPLEGRVSIFWINGTRFVITPRTSFTSLVEDGPAEPINPDRNLRLGAYVRASGMYLGDLQSVQAVSVQIRDDWNHTISDLAVIDQITSAGSDRLVDADGFRIRLPATTKISFRDPLSAISDVHPGDWIHYEGKLDPSGYLVASHATFLSAKPVTFRGVFGGTEDLTNGPQPRNKTDQTASNSANAQPDATINPLTGRRHDLETILDSNGDLTQDAIVHLGRLKGWATIPASSEADRQLQHHIRLIGEKLVPAYQRDLPDDSPLKIHFHFYVVDAPGNLRTIVCPLTGLILAPRTALERLNTDDQVAALFGFGVASNLQHLTARIATATRTAMGLNVAANVAGHLVPFAGLALLPMQLENSDKLDEMLLSKGRTTLSLLAAAGFDPWQAPTALRRLQPKHLPHDLASIPYDDLGGYLLSILNLEYGKPHPVSQPAE